jgi:Asp-tRNA(Asn)/Glu-tRNA(Gln) amidotransferase A subunit family amidase
MGRTKAGLPMGLQVVGGPFGEQDLLSLSWDLEEAMPWQQTADTSPRRNDASFKKSALGIC